MLRYVLLVHILLALVTAETEQTCTSHDGFTVCHFRGVLSSVTQQRNENRLEISDLNLLSIKPGAFKDLTITNLYLYQGNHISNLQSRAFTGLPKLTRLHLDNNVVTLIPNLFQELSQLESLSLIYNKINNIPTGTFTGLSKVMWLYLNQNDIPEIKPNMFAGLPQLLYLWLDNNKIATVASGSFANLKELNRLHLDYNRITEIKPNTFTGLTKLETLYVNDNSLTSLPQDTFGGLPELKRLYANHNKIATIHSRAFKGLSNLNILHLEHNEISEIQPGAFEGLVLAEEIFLSNNRIHTLPNNLFVGLTRINLIYMANNTLTQIDKTSVQLPSSTTVYFTQRILVDITITKVSTNSSRPANVLSRKILHASARVVAQKNYFFNNIINILLNDLCARLPHLSLMCLADKRKYRLFIVSSTKLDIKIRILSATSSKYNEWAQITLLPSFSLSVSPFSLIPEVLIKCHKCKIQRINTSCFGFYVSINVSSLSFICRVLIEMRLTLENIQSILSSCHILRPFVAVTINSVVSRLFHSPVIKDKWVMISWPTAFSLVAKNLMQPCVKKFHSRVFVESDVFLSLTTNLKYLVPILTDLALTTIAPIYQRSGQRDKLTCPRRPCLRPYAFPNRVFSAVVIEFKPMYYYKFIVHDQVEGYEVDLYKRDLRNSTITNKRTMFVGYVRTLRANQMFNIPRCDSKNNSELQTSASLSLASASMPKFLYNFSMLSVLIVTDYRSDTTPRMKFTIMAALRQQIDESREDALNTSDFDAYKDALSKTRGFKTHIPLKRSDTCDILSKMKCDSKKIPTNGRRIHTSRSSKAIHQKRIMIRCAVSVIFVLAVVLAQTEPTCRNVSSYYTLCSSVEGVLTEVTQRKRSYRLQIWDMNLTSIKPGAFKNLSIQNLYLLQGNRISDLEPGAFAGLPNLKNLHLGNNAVRLIPNLFHYLPHLEALLLSNNNITYLPEGTFEGLSQLTVLMLDWNLIATINQTTFSGLPKLFSLNLENNEITTIAPNSFESLQELKYLYLARNNIRELRAQTFKGLTKLDFLTISFNDIVTVSEGAFRELSKLRTLYLDFNKISTIRSGTFIDLNSLKNLYLHDNEISVIEAGAFDGLSSVERISLSNNIIQILPSGLFAGLTNLEKVVLNNNTLTAVNRTAVQLSSSKEILVSLTARIISKYEAAKNVSSMAHSNIQTNEQHLVAKITYKVQTIRLVQQSDSRLNNLYRYFEDSTSGRVIFHDFGSHLNYYRGHHATIISITQQRWQSSKISFRYGST
ncbi:uncharacterized protein LOC124412753 [Diprion similis]|uniref:uncharacterized protein LOC124412753 n=1 Tax=Diprion similis TaxID=362088 RepID=UPI001EF845E2|nr:uncharacterized protein LOC124412753 [Diprion similis]